MEKKEVKEILEIALFAGRIMLENGAETYRVEDTINRICKSRGLEVQNFTVPTGIFLSCNYEDNYYPYIIRTNTMSIDLEIIAKVNDFSREFVQSNMSIEAANARVEIIKNTPKFKAVTLSFFGGIAGGFFTLSFGGSLIEAIFAFITSYVVVSVVNILKRYTGAFVRSIIGGMINTIVALFLIYLFKHRFYDIELSNIVIGSLMPLVPGVAMTNALRDSISGDFVSGVSKLSEAVLIAIAIAMGVGVILHVKILFTGSL